MIYAPTNNMLDDTAAKLRQSGRAQIEIWLALLLYDGMYQYVGPAP